MVVLPEEACPTTEELKYRNTTRAYDIRKEFDEERCWGSVSHCKEVNVGTALTVSQCVISDVVARGIGEDEK